MQKSVLHVGLVTACLLMIPVIGMQMSSEWNWTGGDFMFAFVMIFGTGMLFEIVRMKVKNGMYTAAAGVALATMFLLIWINAAVGIIGDGDLDSPNGLYVGMLILGFIGACVTHFQPRGMARTLFLLAVAQMMIPAIVLIAAPSLVLDEPPGVGGVFMLNAIFAALWVGSGFLFRSTAQKKYSLLEA